MKAKDIVLCIIIGLLILESLTMLLLLDNQNARIEQQADDIKTAYEFINHIIKVDSVQTQQLRILNELPLGNPLTPQP